MKHLLPPPPADAGQPGTEIFNMPASTTAGSSASSRPPSLHVRPLLTASSLVSVPPAGPVSVRCHPAPEAPSNSIGLEAIIRKALMGNYDDQSEERAPPSQASAASVPAGAPLDARAEDFFSQGAPPPFSSSWTTVGGGVWSGTVLGTFSGPCVFLQVEESPPRAAEAPTGGRPSLRDRACPAGRGRPRCPRSTRRETATDAPP